MSRLIFLFILLYSSSICSSIFAQRCGAELYNSELKKNERQRSINQEKLFKFYKARFDYLRTENEECERIFRIPVAIHYTGLAPSQFDCAKGLAIKQIESLNADFQAKNKDVKNWFDNDAINFPNVLVTGACIEFVLANQNHPKGYGLTKGDPAITFNKINSVESADFSKYLNIFVRDVENGILGYSPLGGEGYGDGVVVNLSAFGANGRCGTINSSQTYDRGRTLTHEVGHWLFLHHTFNDGCEVGDAVDDTPSVAQPNGGCPVEVISCNSRDMTMNYLDYTDDKCMYAFTLGQVSRMERYVFAVLPHLTDNAKKVYAAPEVPTDTIVSPVITDTLVIADTPVVDVPTSEVPQVPEMPNVTINNPWLYFIGGLIVILLFVFGTRSDQKLEKVLTWGEIFQQLQYRIRQDLRM